MPSSSFLASSGFFKGFPLIKSAVSACLFWPSYATSGLRLMGGCAAAAAAADSDAGDFLPFDGRVAELRPFTSIGVKRTYFGLIYL